MLKITRRNIAVEPLFDPDKIGSIIVPDVAKERCDQGIVKYVGDRCRWLSVGDYVLFSGYSGDLLRLEGEGLLIVMPEQAVVAKIYEVPPVEVKGVYYRERFDKEKARDALYELLMDIDGSLENYTKRDLAHILANKGVTPPAALNFFPATYETLISQITTAFHDQPWRQQLGIKNKRVNKPDYNPVEEFTEED